MGFAALVPGGFSMLFAGLRASRSRLAPSADSVAHAVLAITSVTVLVIGVYPEFFARIGDLAFRLG